jgi:hypothetical protein
VPSFRCKGILTDLLDASRDAEAVQRAHHIEGFQDHQIERSLQYFGPGFIHGHLHWHGQRKNIKRSFGMSIGTAPIGQVQRILVKTSTPG